MSIDEGLRNLQDEGDYLEGVVRPLTDEQWRLDTPAEGWSIATQIAHLAWTDDVALWSATEDARFEELMGRLTLSTVDDDAHEIAKAPQGALIGRWQEGRRRLAATLAKHEGKLRWFGPPMSPRSMVSARIMETWAHGVDISDALEMSPHAGPGLRDVAHIGVRTRNFAYALNEVDVPAEEFRIELTGPGGDQWVWGPEGATASVIGPALDFCLLVTQRRHRDDLSLSATGQAGEWLGIAQAFAGPPGGGREPLGA